MHTRYAEEELEDLTDEPLRADAIAIDVVDSRRGAPRYARPSRCCPASLHAFTVILAPHDHYNLGRDGPSHLHEPRAFPP